MAVNHKPSASDQTQTDTHLAGNVWANGTLVSSSDRNVKENFQEANASSILEKVARLPVQFWNYRNDDRKVRHLGPVAQDFFATFSVGPDDKHIATVDESGVALAAIQALYREWRDVQMRLVHAEADADAKDMQLRELRARFASQQGELANMNAKVSELQKAIELVVTSISKPGGLAMSDQ